MVSPQDFSHTVRAGRHGGSRHLVVHYVADQSGSTQPLVGFVVPKRELALAVDRNRVERRLRHLMREIIGQLASNSLTVIRVKHAAKYATYDQLRHSLHTALTRVGALSMSDSMREHKGTDTASSVRMSS